MECVVGNWFESFRENLAIGEGSGEWGVGAAARGDLGSSRRRG